MHTFQWIKAAKQSKNWWKVTYRQHSAVCNIYNDGPNQLVFFNVNVYLTLEYPLLLLLSFCCHFREYDIVFNNEFDKWQQNIKLNTTMNKTTTTTTRQIIILNMTMNKTTTRQQQNNKLIPTMNKTTTTRQIIILNMTMNKTTTTKWQIDSNEKMKCWF